MFPSRKRQTARKLAAEVTEVFGSYISGQVIVSAITGAVIAIATAIIGFKFSLIIGIISAVAYAIPIHRDADRRAHCHSDVRAAGPVDDRLGASDHVRHGAHQRQRARSQDHGQVRRRFADRRDVRGLRRRRALRDSRTDLGNSGGRADQDPVALLHGAVDKRPAREKLASAYGCATTAMGSS